MPLKFLRVLLCENNNNPTINPNLNRSEKKNISTQFFLGIFYSFRGAGSFGCVNMGMNLE